VWATWNLKLQWNAAIPICKNSADIRMPSCVRASRYRGLLHFVTYRVLGDSDRADLAVENCLFSASLHAPSFDCEGPFRGWLVRMALDEALAMLHRRSIPERRRDSSLQEAEKRCPSSCSIARAGLLSCRSS
jgi:DNA-directed RNA polymerase specialized sigma24 family protein